MKLKKFLCIATHLLLANCYSQSSASAGQNDARSAVQGSLPFDLVSGFLIVVQGQIGSMDGLRFIFDTGTTHTVIDTSMVNRLRLHRHRRSAKTVVFDKTIFVELAEIPEMRIGPLHAVSVSVGVAKLDEYSKLAQHVDGIIGLDLLSRNKSLTIDYEHKIVSFEISESESVSRTQSTCFITRLYVQGLPVDLLVDTGLDGIILYRNRLRARLPAMSLRSELTDVWMGPLHLKQARIPDVRISDASEERSVYLLDERPGSTPPSLDGVFGPATLHAKRIQFDFSAGVIRWE